MLDHANARIQRCIDAGIFPRSQDAAIVMHVLWGALTGPAVLGNGCRLARNEDPDALARDILSATLAGIQAGVTLTFTPCMPLVDFHPAVASSGVPDHES
jgi:hypothetical protein